MRIEPMFTFPTHNSRMIWNVADVTVSKQDCDEVGWPSKQCMMCLCFHIVCEAVSNVLLYAIGGCDEATHAGGHK